MRLRWLPASWPVFLIARKEAIERPNPGLPVLADQVASAHAAVRADLFHYEPEKHAPTNLSGLEVRLYRQDLQVVPR